MIEISFRGIPLEWDEFIYGSYVEYKGSHFIYTEMYEKATHIGILSQVQVSPETVGQYTGEKDKKGKKIFNGDILTPYAYTGTIKDKTFKCTVVFKKGMFCFNLNKPFIDKTDPLYLSLNRGKAANNEYIIVGNIHENPELME